MEENIFDIAILLGCNYTLENLNSGSLSFLLIIDQSQSFFFKYLMKLLRNLQHHCEPKWLYDKLCFTKYFTELLKVDKKVRGFCNVCGMYSYELTEHLNSNHSLISELITMHSKMFSNTDYVFMPSDFILQAHMPVKSRLNEKNGFLGPENQKKSSETSDKSNVVEVHCENGGVNSVTGFESGEYVECEKCGERVHIKRYKPHLYNHKIKQLAECTHCGKELSKKNLPRHLKTCVENTKKG